MLTVKIDEEFKNQIPPITDEEFLQLELNLLAEGCRDALIVWQDNILLDGHNRFEICKKHNLPFGTVKAPDWIKTREDAKNWIDKNQLGRRNLSPDQESLMRGRIYNRVKKAHGGDRKSSGKNYHLKTAEKLASEYSVSEKTIRNDGQYAGAIERLKDIDPDIEKKINKKQAPPKKDILKASKLIDENPEKAKAVLKGDKPISLEELIDSIKADEKMVKKIIDEASKEVEEGRFDPGILSMAQYTWNQEIKKRKNPSDIPKRSAIQILDDLLLRVMDGLHRLADGTIKPESKLDIAALMGIKKKGPSIIWFFYRIGIDPVKVIQFFGSGKAITNEYQNKANIQRNNIIDIRPES